MFNNYWWRSGTKKGKGLNWLAWNNMSMSKTKGGLDFQNLYGFNIALLEKQCWNFLSNPQSLVTRVYKARYFPNVHILKAKKGANPSFIWKGIMTAMETLHKGFRSVLGNGEDIQATKDPCLRTKTEFRVDNNHIYEGRYESVSHYFLSNTKQ